MVLLRMLMENNIGVHAGMGLVATGPDGVQFDFGVEFGTETLSSDGNRAGAVVVGLASDVLPSEVAGWAELLSGPAELCGGAPVADPGVGLFSGSPRGPSHPPISIKSNLGLIDCHTGCAVKALGNGRIGGYLVRFTNALTPDLVGDFFTAETELGLKGDEGALPVFYQHGQDAVVGKSILGEAKVRRDTVGIWVDAQLQLRDEYQAAIYRLAEDGKLGWSSGAVAHLVERKVVGRSTWLKTWWIAEASLTPTPAEPGNGAIVFADASEASKAARDDLAASDFVLSEERKFPVMNAEDVADAVSSWGRYKGPVTFEQFKERLIRLAKRKGLTAALPDLWRDEMAKSLVVGGARTNGKRAVAVARVRGLDKAADFSDEAEGLVPEAEAVEPVGNELSFEKSEDVSAMDTIVDVVVEQVGRKDVDALKAQIAALTARLDAPVVEGGKVAPYIKKLGGDHDGSGAFKHWLRTGVMNSYTKNNEQDWSSTKAAMNETTAGEGGILVPEGLHNMIIAKRDEQSVVRSNGALVISTDLDTVQVPVENARMTTAIVAESGSYVQAEPTFTSNSVPVYKFGNQLRLTEELLADEKTNIMGYLANGLGRAFGLMENQYCIAGTGSSQPKGLITGGTAAVTAASTTAITAAELVSLYHALPEPYTTNPAEVVFITRNATLGALRALASSSVFTFNLQPQGDQGAQQLYGHKVAVSGYMQAATTGLKSLLVTNLAAGYIFIERAGMVMQRNPYLLQATGQVALFSTMRFGGTTTVAEATQILTQA